VLVFGVEADGTEHEITGTGFGTRIRSLTTGMSVVGSGGSVLALRRGSDLLVIEHGEHRIEVPVVADWPDVVDHADGTPAAGGITPRIQFVDAEPEAGLEVHCTGLPARELCFLIISTKPIPRHMPERFGMVGVKLLPIPREGSSATLMLPDPASNGQPMFLRCVVFEPGLKSFHVVSNALVLTRG